ncbi:hypothetical protein [Endozoicomonas ascidiicola]|uniref:hypothetical protein n=1 Tax=Endozoicomonas ascidiicola TaxID=1698521 RepID=UPI0008360F90|nr:hypothetical protein [Endozoicomonas ascidiicola]
MSINYSEGAFQLRGLDAARFIRNEGGGLIKALVGFFRGRTVTDGEYSVIKSKTKNHSPEMLKRFRTIKRIQSRNIELFSARPKLEINLIDLNSSYKDEDLKAARTNKNEVSDEDFDLREDQDLLFKDIKNRLEDHGYKPSIFDHKESSEIMKMLESLEIFDSSEIQDIRDYLADELDTSPYWK